MRGYNGWSYRPYSPYDQIEKRFLPYICRVAPGEAAIELEWFDASADDGGHQLYFRKYKTDDEFIKQELTAPTCTIEQLEPDCDYEFYVARADGSGSSDVRLARTGKPVGTVVNYLHPDDECYAYSGRSLCSPSIVKLPSGALLASMDVFALQAPQNLTLIYRSDDNGEHWHFVTELFPCFWGKLFYHRDALYMLATATEYGDLLIGKSADEGKTWSAPVTIMTGAGSWGGRGPHKAPMPVTQLENRLYTAIDYGSWSTGGHRSGLISIDADADLMVAENWVCTGFLPYDDSWEGAAPKGKSGGGLEGNAVAGPDGEIYNVLRYQMEDYGKALVLKGNKNRPEEPLQFHSFADFNGGSNAKFDLLYDEPSGAYWAIVNEIVDEKTPTQRNVLSLAVSRDMQHFKIVNRLLDYRHENPADVGFQYVSFLFDGDDILYLCRTGFNQAKNMHDANYSTFHRIERFRQYLPKE
ncbi:sialidase family protein [Paenibacillus sp. GCM10027626]|uniref:sialidase family protein n=1 Tax=Paenibacillus sp. GCM10027626 TaxID=3273411 RepID=UPI00363D8EDD